MKILLCSHHPFDPDSGVSGMVWSLGNALRKLGVEVDFYFSDKIKNLRGFKRLLLAPIDTIYIQRMLREKDYEIVDVSSGNGYLSMGIKRSLGKKTPIFIMRSHGLEHHILEIYQKYYLLFEWSWRWKLYFKYWRVKEVEWSMKLADGVIVASEEQKETIERNKWKDENRIWVIPHGIKDEFILKEEKKWKPPIKALWVGWWGRIKGDYVLFKSFDHLWKEGVEIYLTVVGVGNTPLPFKLSCEKFQKYLCIIPHLSAKELKELYKTHQIFVFPSLYEGFGMALFESAANRMAIITTDTGAGRYFTHEENCLKIKFNDPPSLTDAVKRLMLDMELMKKIGENAEKLVREYTWEKIATETLKVYQEILRKSNC